MLLCSGSLKRVPISHICYTLTLASREFTIPFFQHSWLCFSPSLFHPGSESATPVTPADSAELQHAALTSDLLNKNLYLMKSSNRFICILKSEKLRSRRQSSKISFLHVSLAGATRDIHPNRLWGLVSPYLYSVRFQRNACRKAFQYV